MYLHMPVIGPTPDVVLATARGIDQGAVRGVMVQALTNTFNPKEIEAMNRLTTAEFDLMWRCGVKSDIRLFPPLFYENGQRVNETLWTTYKPDEIAAMGHFSVSVLSAMKKVPQFGLAVSEGFDRLLRESGIVTQSVGGGVR